MCSLFQIKLVFTSFGIHMCHQFEGDLDWPHIEDRGVYCQMHAQGGDILLCDMCLNVFCNKCLAHNLDGNDFLFDFFQNHLIFNYCKVLIEITKLEERS